MGELASLEVVDDVAVITLDDGKVNALSREMQDAAATCLTRAADEAPATVLRGNARAFCAGFDLGTIREGGDRAEAMVLGGFDLAIAMLEHPRPLVLECTGHAMAMGVFLLLSGDLRIGGTHDYKITANEVAIGMTMPHAALELMRQRLTPAAMGRAAILADVFTPEEAVAAGFLDRLSPPERLHDDALAAARQLGSLSARAHRETKRRIRGPVVAAVRAAIATDASTFRIPPTV